MGEHALLSASGSSRWLNCPPSARLCEKLEKKSSVYAEEGSFAHSLAERRLKMAIAGVGKWHKEHTGLERDAFYSTSINASACAYTDFCMEYVEEARKCDPNPLILVEEKVNFSKYVPEGFGTLDFGIACTDFITAIDYKNGKGVQVEAYNNTQMMLYFLGLWGKVQQHFDPLGKNPDVILSIVQPAFYENGDTWAVPLSDILAWAEEIKPVAQLAWEGKGEYKSGKHCKFCDVKARCKKRTEDMLAFEKAEKDPNLLSLADVGKYIYVAENLKSWYTDLTNFALKALIDGKEVPGWKLVEGRSNRAIKDENAAIKILRDNFIDEKDYLSTPGILGITALETNLGKKVFKQLLGDQIVKPTGKPSLKPEDDPKPALNNVSELVFQNLDE